MNQTFISEEDCKEFVKDWELNIKSGNDLKTLTMVKYLKELQ